MYLSNAYESLQNYAKYQDIDYLEETGTTYKQKNSADNGWQNISQKVKKIAKDKPKKLRYLLLCIFWTLLPKMHFCSGDWRPPHVCIQCLGFPNISYFFKIQILSPLVTSEKILVEVFYSRY